MEPQLNANGLTANKYFPASSAGGKRMTEFANGREVKNLLQHHSLPTLEDFLAKLGVQIGKESFLVFKNNKYFNVRTEDIAFFYIKHDSSMIVNFNNQEFFVNYSLEQIQNLLPEKQFYRLNRQYLISFNAIREVEHYFARKLLVNPVVPVKEKLVVSKEKVSSFLHWLDNR